MSEAITGVKPELFWRCFAEICRIPRPSGHEDRIRSFVLDRAKSLGLDAKVDAGGNVVVSKAASPGREAVRSICLQGHLDMVCEKNAGKVHDFLKDPIELIRDGDVITANGTTLGADNGVAVATNLAIMEDSSLVHGPLELLFTVEEETGLTGAKNLAADVLQSRTLLNLDSEDEGVLYIGCAGGRDTVGRWEIRKSSVPADAVAVRVTVRGLKGGHSGLEIDKGLGNAIKILNRVLLRLFELDARLSSIDGGNMRNAIPRECSALLFIPPKNLDRAESLVAKLRDAVRAELAAVDPDVDVTMATQTAPERTTVLAPEIQRNLALTIAALPTGAQQMSAEIPGLVETSTNVAVISTSDKEIAIVTSQRSSVASRLSEVAETVESVFRLGGATVEGGEGYPGWRPDLTSPILKSARECYQALYGREAEVKAVHAGLECGIIGERIPGMDMISFGPTLEMVHSPDERIHISSVEKYWNFLLAILKSAQ
jgi:dipeptidase D